MLDIDILEARNNRYIQILLEKYDIQITTDNVIDLASIYIATEYKKDDQGNKTLKPSRIRLMGTQKIYLIENTQGFEKKIDTKKTKKIQLYVISNKKIQNLLEENELESIVNDFSFLCSIVKESQEFLNIRLLESSMYFAKPPSLD